MAQADCTAGFAAVAQAWLDQWDANYSPLAALLGEQTIRERQAERRGQLRAVADGILARSLLTATGPEDDRRRRRL